MADHPPQTETTTQVVDGITIEVARAGTGRPLLYLHSVDGVNPDFGWFRGLAESFQVIAPWHPGFGVSELPQEFRTVGDLAFFYLELVRTLQIRDAVLIGSSFGGWLAAEIAIRSTNAFSKLVLIDPLGIKVGGREDRDVVDVFALPVAELARLAYHRPELRKRDYSTMSDAERLSIARSREAFAYFGWRPYMHNPSLRRWLRRVRVPTLVVWGADDGIVSTDYGRAYAQEIPDSRFEVIKEAGHYPHVEQPGPFLELVRDFTGTASSARSVATEA